MEPWKTTLARAIVIAIIVAIIIGILFFMVWILKKMYPIIIKTIAKVKKDIDEEMRK